MLDSDGTADRRDDGSIDFDGPADANVEGLLDFAGPEDGMDNGSLDSNGIEEGKLDGLNSFQELDALQVIGWPFESIFSSFFQWF